MKRILALQRVGTAAAHNEAAMDTLLSLFNTCTSCGDTAHDCTCSNYSIQCSCTIQDS
jgi:hypothetical protein